jgi:hypothetical protein
MRTRLERWSQVTRRGTSLTIVGVVDSVASRQLGESPEPEIYLSELQSGQSAIYLVVREAPWQCAGSICTSRLMGCIRWAIAGDVAGNDCWSCHEKFPFGISSFDTRTVAVTLLGFFVLALLASWIPTARVARADVLLVLRDE